MNESAQAIQSAMELFNKFENLVRFLDPDADEEEVYQATKRLMTLALQVKQENNPTQ